MSTRRTRRTPRCASAQPGSIPPFADDDAEWSDLVVEGLDLSGIVAATLTITGCVLRDVSLTGASIGELRIANSVFERCELSGFSADRLEVAQSEFRGCRMDGAVVGGGRWLDVGVLECSAREASMRMTTWQRAEFVDSVMPRVDFTEADLGAASFEGCDLGGAQFWGATMLGVTLRGSALGGVRGGLAFRGARIDALQITDIGRTLFEGLDIVVLDDAT